MRDKIYFIEGTHVADKYHRIITGKRWLTRDMAEKELARAIEFETNYNWKLKIETPLPAIK